MPRRPRRTAPTLVIPGWHGSGPEHWQTVTEDALRADGREVLRPDLPDLDAPDRGAWLTALRAALSDLPADGYDVLAHSLGSVLWLHHVADPGDSPRAARVLLASPPSPATQEPQLQSFFPPPLDVDPVRQGADGTVLVAGSDDEYLPEGIAAAYGVPLKIATTVVEGGGHLNVDSGYGEWPAVLDWCRRDNLAFF